MGDLARLRWVVLGALIAVALVSSLVAILSGSQWQDALLNFGTEMAGAVVTYGLFELIIERRERRKARETELESRKAELIGQMGSKANDVAVAAAEELRRRGWLQNGSLIWADLVGANLQGAQLWSANLQAARLWSANLQGANLRGADLEGAFLGHVNLQGAILEEANLQGALLWHSNLQGAELWSANLQGTDLMGTNLQEAHLLGANLQGANLMDTNLQEADLTKAEYNNATIWPEGFTPPPEAINVDAETEVEA